MKHLEGSGMPVPYIGRKVLKGCNTFSFGYLPGVRVLKADVSELSVGSIFIYRWNRQRDPKRRFLALGRRGDTQKKTHYI